MQLLTPPRGNAKLAKSQGRYIVVGLSLAPHKLSGQNLCSSSTPECRRYCLNYTGMAGVYPSIIKARIRKAQSFLSEQELFLAQLKKELHFWFRKSKSQRKKLACRLNVFSDVMWEKIDRSLFDLPVQFYDYTKHIKRYQRWLNHELPANYHLTFSRSELNEVNCLDFLEKGGNITVVTQSEMWHGHKTISGDDTDLRFLDPPGSVIRLKPKGKLKKSNSNFVSIGDLNVTR